MVRVRVRVRARVRVRVRGDLGAVEDACRVAAVEEVEEVHLARVRVGVRVRLGIGSG